MNAVTTTNKNQCVDVSNAGDANDMQIIPKTWKWKTNWILTLCIFHLSNISEFGIINAIVLQSYRHHEVAMIQLQIPNKRKNDVIDDI